VKYLLLIYHNEKSRDVWQAMSPAQRAEGFHAHEELTENLTEAGELIVAGALADPSRAVRVTVDQRGVVPTDGPFAEAKEHLAGFYLIESDSIDSAVARAAMIPEARLGLVEIRPLLEPGGTDM